MRPPRNTRNEADLRARSTMKHPMGQANEEDEGPVTQEQVLAAQSRAVRVSFRQSSRLCIVCGPDRVSSP